MFEKNCLVLDEKMVVWSSNGTMNRIWSSNSLEKLGQWTSVFIYGQEIAKLQQNIEPQTKKKQQEKIEIKSVGNAQ